MIFFFSLRNNLEFNFIFRNLKAAEAEEAKRLAEEKAAEARKKGEEARHLEEELLIAQQGLEESQRKLADVTSKNLVSVVTNGSNSSINNNNNHHNNHHHHHSNNVTSSSSAVRSLSNYHLSHLEDNENENDEDDDSTKDKDVELRLNESLPPEQYREPAVDKNQKMKQQLEVIINNHNNNEL